MPTNWKYIKKLLEKEFLCEKLRGHITYDLTDYRPAPWYQQHFIMKYDAEVLLDVSQPERMWDKKYRRTEVNWGHRDRIAKEIYNKYRLDDYSLPQHIIEALTGYAISEADKITSHYAGIYGVHDIIDLIGAYLHADIEESLSWAQDPFITALAILDRRCGKRRLQKYADWDYTDYPDWLKRIYQIRFDAEKIPYHKNYITDLKHSQLI